MFVFRNFVFFIFLSTYWTFVLFVFSFYYYSSSGITSIFFYFSSYNFYFFSSLNSVQNFLVLFLIKFRSCFSISFDGYSFSSNDYSLILNDPGIGTKDNLFFYPVYGYYSKTGYYYSSGLMAISHNCLIFFFYKFGFINFYLFWGEMSVFLYVFFYFLLFILFKLFLLLYVITQAFHVLDIVMKIRTTFTIQPIKIKYLITVKRENKRNFFFFKIKYSRAIFIKGKYNLNILA